MQAIGEREERAVWLKSKGESVGQELDPDKARSARTWRLG